MVFQEWPPDKHSITDIHVFSQTLYFPDIFVLEVMSSDICYCRRTSRYCGECVGGLVRSSPHPHKLKSQ